MKEPTREERNNSAKRNYLQLVLQYTALFLALFAVLGTLLFPLDKQAVSAAGYGGVFVVALLSAVSLLPGPSAIAAFVAGGTLNPFLVSLAAGLGSALGESTGYLAGYGSHGLLRETDAPQRLAKTRIYIWFHQKIVMWMAHHPFVTLLGIAAIPNFFVDIGGLIAGRTKYPYYRFLVAMVIGKSIRFAMGAYLGDFLIR